MRYLTEEQLKSNLSLGKSVEQWINHEKHDDYTVLKWLRIDKERNPTYSVSYIECFDDGNEHFTDIYHFDPLDPDEPYIIDNFESIDEALAFAINSYAASQTRFVSAGMIQEEYKDFLNSK